MKQGEWNWDQNPAFAFRYQGQPLAFAMNSQLTRAHWGARLSWLFHKPVGDVDGLGEFADGILGRPRHSRARRGRDSQLHAGWFYSRLTSMLWQRQCRATRWLPMRLPLAEDAFVGCVANFIGIYDSA